MNKPIKCRCHLPLDEMTHRHSSRAEPSFRPQYGENRRSPHFRKDVSPIKFNNINDRNPKIFTNLDGLSASPCHHSSDHRRSLRPEETNHPSAQSTAIAILNVLTELHFFVPPCFFRTKKHFVRGGDVEGASRQSRLERGLT